MCITFLMFNPDAGVDQWQMVLINNRDEHYDRPASVAAWKDGVLAGRDMKEGPTQGGTWFCMGETGRFGVLMNILEPPDKAPPNPTGRGYLALNFAKDSQHTPISYVEKLGRGENFPGFALLLLEKTKEKNEKWRSAYYTNRWDSNVEVLTPGVYGFGNCPRNRPFLKVQRGLQMFQQTLFKYLLTTDSDKGQFVEDLVRVLKDKESCFPDGQLQSQCTHMTPELQKKLSSCFVEFPGGHNYGTRTHTIILVDGQNNVTHVERTMNENDFKAPWMETKHEFQLTQHD